VITTRAADDRGRTLLDWLDSRYTFSFGDYYDPKQMGYLSLRVINDDRVTPGAGFGTHGHPGGPVQQNLTGHLYERERRPKG